MNLASLDSFYSDRLTKQKAKILEARIREYFVKIRNEHRKRELEDWEVTKKVLINIRDRQGRKANAPLPEKS